MFNRVDEKIFSAPQLPVDCSSRHHNLSYGHPLPFGLDFFLFFLQVLGHGSFVRGLFRVFGGFDETTSAPPPPGASSSSIHPRLGHVGPSWTHFYPDPCHLPNRGRAHKPRCCVWKLGWNGAKPMIEAPGVVPGFQSVLNLYAAFVRDWLANKVFMRNGPKFGLGLWCDYWNWILPTNTPDRSFFGDDICKLFKL